MNISLFLKEKSLNRYTVFWELYICSDSQLNTEWAQVEVIDLINDGSGLAFGIIGGRSSGVVVKTILPGGVADRVSIHLSLQYVFVNVVV